MVLFWPLSHPWRYQQRLPAEDLWLSHLIIWPQPSDNSAKEPILQITCKQVNDTNCFMWLILSEKALCKQFLWLKTIIICQLQYATQWGTSVPHFCHLSHIAVACVTHWQNSKGWEVWLWSWEYECTQAVSSWENILKNRRRMLVSGNRTNQPQTHR